MRHDQQESYLDGEVTGVRAEGAVKIIDAFTGEVILNQKNAIHPQNLARIFARGLAHEDDAAIHSMAFGNGGTFYNSSTQLIFRAPNTVGTADLYNKTYEILVDEFDPGTPSTNSTMSGASPTPAISSVTTIQAILAPNEPAGQAISDGITTDPEALFMFDEIGLKSRDGLLLSHLVFTPIEKTANRAFLITYTLTISCS